MFKKNKPILWILGITALASVIAGIYFTSIRYARQADRIIRETGTAGGLIVHVNCGNGKLTAALYAGDPCLVHGLSRSPEDLERAGDYISKKGLNGKVSLAHWQKGALPYSDNLVNLLLIDGEEPLPGQEVMRVLAPGGTAMTKKEGQWIREEKPWPDRIDEWTHYMHGPDGNLVSMDSVVGPPGHIQWMAGPNWGRDHRYGNNIAMVSAGGRIFYLDNEIPQESVEYLPDRPFLVARDAFNGILLWKKPVYPRLPVDLMEPGPGPEEYEHHEPLFPVELKMVATQDRVFAAFGPGGEIQVLDASTGELIDMYSGTGHTEEILYAGGTLLTVVPVNESELEEMKFAKAELPYGTSFKRDRGDMLRALDPGTGEVLWELNTSEQGGLHVSPVIKDDHVFVIIDNELLKLSLSDGKVSWRRPLPDHTRKGRFSSMVFSSGPSVRDRLIATGEFVILAACQGSNSTIVSVFSASTGEPVWHRRSKTPKCAGSSAYVVRDRLWVHDKYPEVEVNVQGRPSNQLFPLIALDLSTGEQVQRHNEEKIFDIDHHHRCYGDRATCRFLLTGRRGVEFTDFGSGEIRLNHWVRGKCRFGVLPCNGLLYSLAHGCACYPFSMLKGYAALAPEGAHGISDEAFSMTEGRLEKGPYYAQAEGTESAGYPVNSDAWPTYRHDAWRSGSTPAKVDPEDLNLVLWSTSLGSEPGGLTAAGGRIFACTPETHQVYALDAGTGNILWNYVAGGRVDSPPTLYNGLVVFGSGDGHVYCLRADNGGLVWRFRAAPEDRRMIDDNRLESVWPVHGAVLLWKDKIYVSAGRTSLLDGGIPMYVLEPSSGKVLASGRIHDPPEETEPEMIGNTGHRYYGNIGVWNDILIGTDSTVCLKQLQMDEHLKPTGKQSEQLVSLNGMLNPNWFSRIGAFFGQPSQTSRGVRPSDTYDFQQSPRQGTYIIYDDELTYSVRVHPNMGKFRVSFEPGGKGYRICADDNRTMKNKWNIMVPLRAQAMVATGGNTLFLAGPPDIVDKNDPWGAIEGRKGGLLWAVSAKDGQKLAEYKLDAPPVFDGMIAAGGRLFISGTDGKVICLGKN